MRVKMLTTFAGHREVRNANAGDIIDVPDTFGRDLLDGKYAVEVAVPPPPPAPCPCVVKDESGKELTFPTEASWRAVEDVFRAQGWKPVAEWPVPKEHPTRKGRKKAEE